MKLSCDVIRDLLPLYAEDMVSSDTRALVEEHLEACPKCKTELEGMKQPAKYSLDTNTAPLRKVQKKLLNKRIFTAVISVLVTMVIAVTTIAYLSTPSYLPYSREIVSVTKTDTGAVYLNFSEDVSGYDINKYVLENGTGFEYSIKVWNSTWSNIFSKRGPEAVVLNPNQENVVSVYYIQPTMSRVKGPSDANILIYGQDLYPGGGIVTLPRLFLAYYVYLAILTLGVLTILYLIFRKKESARSKLEKLIPLPLSYLMGNLCIKGVTMTSYSAKRDFLAIILVMMPVYGVFLLGIHYYRRYRRKNERG